MHGAGTAPAGLCPAEHGGNAAVRASPRISNKRESFFGRIEEGESERECAMDIPCQTMRQKQYLHLYAGVSMLFGTGSKVHSIPECSAMTDEYKSLFPINICRK